ncbi:toll/interleukin-1 receptor domain-containing protein [Frankia sp. R82]|uniref:TIR domain-containing protein n=1 Tax=Frankia sp. R82 TaxID=2950553 RepID=UPI002042FF28|nr:toll/interleukin-1 receptor domain-containing protein [Frankia sp. R82]MCM3884214.1 toll/interleukin-1 receptor domain-containing protein [Frankia sp. R82]
MSAHGAPGEDDVLIEASELGIWAWVGLRLFPGGQRATAATPDALADQHHAAARAGDQEWLAAHGTAGDGNRFEIRYTNDPSTRTVSAVLLGQIHRPPHAGTDIVAAARVLRDDLAATPGHVRAEALTSADEIRRQLRPFTPDLGSVFEVRKRLAWAPCTRRDTGRWICLAVVPFDGGGLTWEAVWAELADLPHRALVSVCLEPYSISPGLRIRLQNLAGEYTRLAAPGTAVPVWGVAVASDPFAAAVAPLYLDAVRRYVGRVYRLRISIVSEAPLPARFAETLAGTVSASGDGAAVVCRPVGHEAQLAWQHIAVSGQGWLDAAYRQGVPPGQLRPEEQILTDLVDAREGAAAFRLPYQLPWRRPLFDSGEAPAASAASAPSVPAAVERYDLFVSYSRLNGEWVHTVLVPRLRAAGLRVAIDSENFRIGAPILSEIERVLEESRRTLLVLTTAYLRSEWAEFEHLLTQTADPANRRLRIIPILLEPVRLPARIAMLNHLDLSRPQRVEEGLHRLIGQLLGPVGAGSDQGSPGSGNGDRPENWGT